MTKKIAILVKALTSGGAEKQAVLLSKVLNSHYEVHFIIFKGKRCERKYLEGLDELPKRQIHKLSGNLLFRLHSLYKCLESNHIDVLVCYLTAMDCWGALIGRFAKTPKIYSGIRNARLPVVKEMADRIVTNYLSTGTIINCYSGKDYFIGQGFAADKLKVIPNCFERMLPYQDRFVTGKLKIISVGRFVKQKDYYTALKSISLLKGSNHDFIFQIIGYGGLENEIRSWIRTLGIGDIVEIHINPDNITSLLLNANIYLSTSLFEGTSNAILEAMNASLPIVATNVGDNSELVQDGKNGYLLEVKDYTSIAEKLGLLLSDTQKCKDMGKHSNCLLHEKFSVDTFRSRYIRLIEQ